MVVFMLSFQIRCWEWFSSLSSSFFSFELTSSLLSLPLSTKGGQAGGKRGHWHGASGTPGGTGTKRQASGPVHKHPSLTGQPGRLPLHHLINTREGSGHSTQCHTTSHTTIIVNNNNNKEFRHKVALFLFFALPSPSNQCKSSPLSSLLLSSHCPPVPSSTWWVSWEWKFRWGSWVWEPAGVWSPPKNTTMVIAFSPLMAITIIHHHHQ